jgi:hypothetical protein
MGDHAPQLNPAAIYITLGPAVVAEITAQRQRAHFNAA